MQEFPWEYWYIWDLNSGMANEQFLSELITIRLLFLRHRIT